MKKIILLILIVANAELLFAQELREIAVDKPSSIADLKSTEGAALVNAKWYVQPASIKQVGFKRPGPALTDALLLYPSGKPIITNTLYPQFDSKDFDKSFKEIRPTDLELRQGSGLVSFVWYKVELTIPETIGKLNTEGTTAIFEVVVDDYSEVWVNGKQTQVFGEIGNGSISGYNSRNRILLTDNAKPGDHFSIAILGINGPIGKIPQNYIWIRNAVVDFYKEFPVNPAWKDAGKIFTVDEKLNSIIPSGTKIEKIADGFQFTEGPVWHPDGYLLFSDPNTNTIYRYDPKTHNTSVYISHSGYTGSDIGDYGQPGSNGLAIDEEGRLIVCQHGNRRVIRHEKKGPVTVLVDNIDGKKLNSPNDLVLRSDGTLYITDPPYGLPKFYDDPKKELDFQGVIMYRLGKVQVVAKDCGGPNGIAFSPDEKYLYVTNWDIRDVHNTKTIWRYEVNQDGSLKNGKIFYDMNQTEDDEALDGLKIDREGNLFVSAPGGIWIISPDAKLLGKIITPERPANMAWGDEDGKSLYMTAHSSLYKIRINTGGKFSWSK